MTTEGLPRHVPAMALSLVRGVLLLLCLSVVVITTPGPRGVVTAGALTAAAGAGLLLPEVGTLGRVARAVEAAVWALVVNATGVPASPYLTYLLAPALIGGLAEGPRAAVVVPGTAAGVLLAAHVADPGGVTLASFSGTATQWVVLAVVVGLLGGLVRRVEQPAVLEEVRVQEAVHHLLLELRTLARRLPGTLDPTTTADAILHQLREVMPFEEGWVLVHSGRDLRPLAAVSGDPLTWSTRVTEPSAISEAWLTLQPAVSAKGHVLDGGGTSGGQAMALPLTLGTSAFGVVALLRRSPEPFTTRELAAAGAAVSRRAMQLDTGLLFDELRASATVEERARMAREIHDGIAQDVASLGYLVDGLAAGASGGSLEPGLRSLRGELTRVVTELRLSLFELRNDVDATSGLGAALSEHVHRVGATSRLTVHVSLSEGTRRLAPQVEAELLRIAHEAVADVRHHSTAQNLWVRCDVAAPRAVLVVEDDGVRQWSRRADDFDSLQAVCERASRIHADVVVGEREFGEGTRVTVTVGNVGSAPRGA